MSDGYQRVIRALRRIEDAPLGTKAPAFNGGAWLKVANGWRWNGHTSYPGDIFPRPMGGWTGDLIYPNDLPARPGDGA